MKMNILIGFEHNYLMPYGVMLQSLIENNQGTPIHVYAIIGNNVTAQDKEQLTSIVCQNKENKIEYFNFITKDISDFPIQTWTHFRESCYYRLFAPSVLPKDVEKILYLDGDMVVCHDLKELWKTDISKYAVAGVMNQTEDVMCYNRLHYPLRKRYINNGVLLINLDFWRKNHLEDRFVDVILNHPEMIVMADQDVLNHVVQDSKIMLPLKYNVQEKFYYKLDHMTFDYWERKEEIEEAIHTPWIIHYAGNIKPWMANCIHPLKGVFFEYRKNTIWRNDALQVNEVKLSLRGRIENLIRRIFYRKSYLKSKEIVSPFRDICFSPDRKFKYSVIIPHKNSQKLLQRLLDSIPRRDDLQIIVVDDNSAPEKVDFNNFPGLNDSHVELYFDKTSKGAGHARNVGLEHAKGKWLVFADADDYFYPNAFSVIDKKIEETNFDIIYFYCNSRDSETGELIKDRVESIIDGIKDKDFDKLRYMSFVPWGKVVNHDVVNKNNLLFDEVEVCNDIMFSTKVGYCSQNIGMIEEALYCCTWTKGSLYSAPSPSRIKTRIRVTERVNDFLTTIGMLKYRTQALHYVFFFLPNHPILFLWAFWKCRYKDDVMGYTKIVIQSLSERILSKIHR